MDLTLAIDVFSRMIVGYYLSLEAPSTTSVAMCIASCILSKKRKLIELNIDAEWQVEGIMDSVHTDNGPDFRTNHIILLFSVHDKFHRTLILSGFCLLKIAKISLNSSFFPKPIKR